MIVEDIIAEIRAMLPEQNVGFYKIGQLTVRPTAPGRPTFISIKREANPQSYMISDNQITLLDENMLDGENSRKLNLEETQNLCAEIRSNVEQNEVEFVTDGYEALRVDFTPASRRTTRPQQSVNIKNELRGMPTGTPEPVASSTSLLNRIIYGILGQPK